LISETTEKKLGQILKNKNVKNKFNILYVDDEESNLLIFKNTFKREYTIYTAKSAKEGIKILKNEPIDIILSDQRMPEISGVEFLKYAMQEHPELHRILITGFTDFKALKSAINEAKIFQYVQKPWEENDLKKVIEEALHIYQLERENKRLIKELRAANSKIEDTNTLLREATETIYIEKERAEQSDRLKSVFLSNISHEVRTPMNGIIGFSELILDAKLDQDKRSEYIQIIIRSCNRLIKIIDDIVEVSKFETKQVKIHYSETDIHKFFEDIHDISKAKLTTDSIEIKLNNQIPEDVQHIVTDEAKLEKIVVNLVENAIKFTYEGYIEITPSLVENYLLVSIKDTGIGIEEKVQEKIFERFRQESEDISQLYDGLGLGLSIVKDNIDIMGGQIDVISEKGKGAVFTIKIPIYNAEDESFIKSSFDFDPFNDDLKTEKQVLIVEDDNINFYYLSTLIKKFDPHIQVLRVDNAKEAFEIIEYNDDVKVVFIDMKMPVIDGFETTQKIRELSPEAILIAQTAYVSEEFKEKALKFGCNLVLEKPLKKQKLSEILDSAFSL
jgi:signal transduction histidine kinase